MTLFSETLSHNIAPSYRLAMQSFSIEYIHPSAHAVIAHYQHLKVGEGKTVRCPYYRNPKSGVQRWGLNAFSGKGSAQEIEEELKIIQKLEGKDFSAMPEEEIRDIMKKRKLGIECSGFVSHVLDAWVLETKKEHVFNVLSFRSRGLFGRIAVFLRPFSHIDVATLISPQNAKEFFAMEEFRPGDLISFHNKIDHVILVTGVVRDEKKKVREIFYAHSVREDTGVGIKEGTIMISDKNKPLVEQQWQETPETGQTIGMRVAHENHHAVVRFFHPLFLP